MKIVGLTGGIACGKSTVSKMFLEKGFPLVDADLIAHNIYTPGSATYQKVVKRFGRDILDDPEKEDSPVNRKKLGAKVFGDEKARRDLGLITKPAITKEMLRQTLVHFLWGAPVVILDVPLLIEAGMNRFCTKVIVVSVSEELQKERLIKRDNSEEEYADKQIASQLPLEVKRAKADIVIDNCGSIEETAAQVDRIAKELSPSTLRKIFALRNCLVLVCAAALVYAIRSRL
mmetsp:Transcript_35076/g.47904  ORF Transcript_35076/g.47904 Transcript_35076/m.47904 type:complete len:231 (+) Transcript_35076:90-782(+)